MNQPEAQFDWNQYLSFAVSSDIGMRRSNNQDSCAVSLAADMESWKREGHLFLVADGMGAHAAGELASKLAADNVVHLYRKYLDMSPPDALERAVREANQEINRRGQENLDFHNMGTTCSVMLLLPQGAMVAHVGDSRVYRLRKHRLHQLTFDHSLVWELREAGQIISDDASPGIPKNVITRSLGPHPSVRIDLEGPFPLDVGDTFLVCSDGLTGCVTDTEIAAVLAAHPPAKAAQLLTDLANLRGGPDNISVVIVRVLSEQMASKNTGTAPLRVGEPRQADRQIPHLYWIVTGVLWLAALAMFALHFTIAAIGLALCGGLASMLLWLMSAGFFRADGIKLAGGRKLGRGPYRDADAPPDLQFATELQRFVTSVQGSAMAQHWPIPSNLVEATVRQAIESLDASRLTDAIDGFTDAIHHFQQAHRSFMNSEVTDS